MARRILFERRSIATSATLALISVLLLPAGEGFSRHPASPPAGPADDAKKEDPQKQARLARGRYLVEGPAACFACHSDVDWKAPWTPVLAGRKGGGAKFPEEDIPFPLYSSNISPDPVTGAGNWTDEQLARAIREGIGHDGRRLFPVMPYMNYRVMSDEDLASIIVYLRSLPPVRNALPTTELPEPVKASLPPPRPVSAPVPPVDSSNPIKRGAYLVALANCVECHTPVDVQGRPLPGLDFAGGRILKGPWGEVASANITPDPSGISYYDQKLFLQVLHTGHVRTRKLNPIMLSGYYRNMTDEDINAIYAYLSTLPPVSHRVDNTESPTLCKRCGSKHGYGERN